MTEVPDVPQTGLILIAGATGYVGGRLLNALERRGHRIRCLARRPEALRSKCLASTEVVAGDVLDRKSLDAAVHGVATAYYLVHSMGSDRSFEDADREVEELMATASKRMNASVSAASMPVAPRCALRPRR